MYIRGSKPLNSTIISIVEFLDALDIFQFVMFTVFWNNCDIELMHLIMHLSIRWKIVLFCCITVMTPTLLLVVK